LWNRQVKRRQEGKVPEAVEDEHGVGEGELEMDKGSNEGEQDDADPECGIRGGA
jgi:hypothetical protein